MGHFIGELEVEKVSGAERVWKLTRPLTYVCDNGVHIAAQQGFRTDFASVPRFLWWLLPPDDTYTEAAVIHDWLYWLHKTFPLATMTRRDADQILFDAMTALGVPAWKRWLIYTGVRIGGRAYWDKE